MLASNRVSVVEGSNCLAERHKDPSWFVANSYLTRTMEGLPVIRPESLAGIELAVDGITFSNLTLPLLRPQFRQLIARTVVLGVQFE